MDLAKPENMDEIAKNLRTKPIVYLNMMITYTVLFGTLAMVLACYDYEDKRPAWAKEFKLN